MATPGTGVCPKCAREVQNGWRACPACATPLKAVNAERETETVFTPPASSSSSIEEGRFPAGTILAGRYRVMGLLGQGGMGEVYRAQDQILNQSVALKFLSRAHMDEVALARFRNEVRIARQVSHPNVCRVYDIGVIEGQHFLSMGLHISPVKRHSPKPHEREVAMSDFGRHRSRQVHHTRSEGARDKYAVPMIYVISSNVLCHLL
jgi:serine/threonine protein kinase